MTIFTLRNGVPLFASLLAVGIFESAAAEDMTVNRRPPEGNAWSLNFTTYTWLPWLTGANTIRGRTFDIDASPRDIVEALDWSTLPSWMSYAELRNGRLLLFNDIVYSKLAGAAGFERSRQDGAVAGAISADVAADLQQTVVEVGAGYEVWKSNGGHGAGHGSIDLVAGGRYWRQEADVSVDLAAFATLNGPLGIADLLQSGGRIFAKSGSVDWIDPFIGARLRYDIDLGQTLMLRGDIGGFGVGSDFTWHAIANYTIELCDTDSYTLDAYIGYRALSVDYSQGSGNQLYEFDAVQHGPVLGAVARF